MGLFCGDMIAGWVKLDAGMMIQRIRKAVNNAFGEGAARVR